jgi:hypothetical protein
MFITPTFGFMGHFAGGTQQKIRKGRAREECVRTVRCWPTLPGTLVFQVTGYRDRRRGKLACYWLP